MKKGKSSLSIRRYSLFVLSLTLYGFVGGYANVWGGELPKDLTPKPYNSNLVFKTIHPVRNLVESPIASGEIETKTDTEPSYSFSGTLEGSWNHVVGLLCFPFRDKVDREEYYACIIGLRAEPLGNNQYQSTGWDKKVFWIDVGDRAPMHVFAIYYPYCVVDGVRYDHVYYAPNFLYLPPDGNPETDTPRDMEIWITVNQNKEVEKTWIKVYDETGDTSVRKELENGDQLLSFVSAIKPGEPEYFYGYTIEDRYQIVKKKPVFSYAHLTPNVDFVNEMTKDYIDFEKVSLFYVLFGQGYTIDGMADYEYSPSLTQPLGQGLQWGDSTAKTGNWLIHEMPEGN